MENSPNSTCPVLAFFCLILTNETPMMGYVIAAVQITFPFAIRAASSGNIQELLLLPSLPGDFFILFSGTVGGKDMAPVSHRGLNCFHIYYAERGLVCEREREREKREEERAFVWPDGGGGGKTSLFLSSLQAAAAAAPCEAASASAARALSTVLFNSAAWRRQRRVPSPATAANTSNCSRSSFQTVSALSTGPPSYKLDGGCRSHQQLNQVT
jgi:hypothetical protein